VANGTLLFSKLVMKKEATYAGGSDTDFASGGRRMTVTPSGAINLGLTYDTGEDRTVGLRTPVVASRVVETAENPEVTIDAPAVTTDDLAIWFAMMEKTTGGTPSGTAAPYTWSRAIGMDSSTNAPQSYAAIVADGNQSYYVSGILPTTLTINAEASGLTSLSMSAFAKSVEKTSQATAESLPTDARGLAGRLWSASYGTAFLSAGTAGGTAFTHLFDWSLELNTGIAPINAQAGTVTLSDFNQFGAAFGGTLSLTVASNPAAVSQLYDKLGTKTFWRLHWQDAASPQHSADLLVCAVPSSVEVIGGDNEGLTTYAVELTLAYDETSAGVFTYQVKNGLTALP
jgi:hypothetical protein